MKTVASRQTPIFKRFREAIRDHDLEIVIEGPKPVADAILAGWIPIAIATKREPRGWGEKEVSFAPGLFETLTDTRSPRPKGRSDGVANPSDSANRRCARSASASKSRR